MTKKYPKYRPAFTLVEMILAIGIVSVIGLAVTGMVYASYQNWELSSRRSNVLQDGQAAMEQMIRILRQAKGFSAVTESTDEAGYLTFTSVDNIIEEFRLNTTTSELEYGQPGALSALAGPVSRLVFTSYDVDENVLTGAVQLSLIQAVNIEATFVNAEDSSVTITLSGRVFIPTDVKNPCLVGWWKMDETSGLTAADSSGNGNDGDLHNMVGNEWASGVLGGALEFDGNNDHVLVSQDSSINDLDDLTLSAWVYLDSYGENTRGRILQKYSSLLWYIDHDQKYQFEYCRWGTDGKWKTDDGTILTGQWYHLAVTYDSSSTANDPVLYIDGASVNVNEVQAPAGSKSSESDDLYIANNPSDTRAFDGRIDDVRIYNCTLSAAEIAKLANILRYREFTEAKAGSDDTSITISTPAGTQENDLLIAVVVTDGDTSSLLAPLGGGGWTQIDITAYSNDVTLGAWWKNAGVSESPSHQFTWSGAEHAYGWMMRFTGHDILDPIDDLAGGGGSSATPTSPAVTTTVNDTIILRLGAFDGSDITEDAPGLTGHTAITMDASGSGTVTLESTTISKETGGSSNFVMSMPAARPDGDLYLAQIAQEGGAQINSIPSGWTEITDRERSGGIRFATYWKIGSSEPATYTWGADSSKKWIGAIHCVSGINTGSPINASGDRSGGKSKPFAPTVTTTVDNCLVLRMYGAEGDEQASTYWPSGTTAIFQDDEGGGTVVSAAAYEYQASAGDTGTGDFSMTGNKKWVAATVAIAPALLGGSDSVSGGAGYVRQSSTGDSGTSTFSLTASQESRTFTIAISPAP